MKTFTLKHILLGLLLSLGFQLNIMAAGKAQNIDSTSRPLASFSTIIFDGGYDVIIVPSDREAISIQTDREKLGKIKTEVINGKLRIYTEEPLQYYKVKLVIRYKSINEIRINGGVNIKNLETLKGESLVLKVAGGGDIKLYVQLNTLKLDFAGGANAEISGNTTDLNVSINGAGRVETEKLMAENAKVEIAGAGYADVYSSKSLDATISGVGSITYSGKPAKVKSQIFGIGAIKEK